jgi:cobalamin synthase
VIALRNLDLVLLAVALVVFLVAGWPLGGWLTAAAVWAMWRGIGWYSEKKAAETTDPKRVVGITTGSMIGRGWLMALILVSVGLLTDDEVGLSAAVLSVVLFTAWFTTKMILRSFEGPSNGSGEVTTP